MVSDTVVFHHPRPIGQHQLSGSGVRPAEMLAAFQELGYQVRVVAGHSGERAVAARALVRDLDAGMPVAFLYSETSTMPPALADPSHLPLRPLVDHRLFKAVRARGVPVGVFYRDLHWRYDTYQHEANAAKRRVGKLFYHLELAGYRRTVDVMFLPSLRMVKALPDEIRTLDFSPLPPGGRVVPPPCSIETTIGRIDLLYVGGVRPPLYDLGPLLVALDELDGVSLTISCRPGEEIDLGRLPPTCSVVHEQGKELLDRFRRSDLSLLVYAPHPYRDFAMPVKLFESICAGVPVIASAGTAAADFVAAEGVGLVVEGAADLRATLTRLRDAPEERRSLRERVLAIRTEHTWEARAREAARVLLERP